MTPQERQRLWARLDPLRPWALGLTLSAFMGGCQAMNMLDPGDSGDESLGLLAVTAGGPLVVNAMALGVARANQRVLSFRRRLQEIAQGEPS